MKARTIVKESFALYKKFWKPLTGFILVSFILSFLGSAGGDDRSFASLIITILFSVAAAIIRFGSVKFAIDAADHKHPTFKGSLKAIFKWSIIWRSIVGSFIVGVITLVSFLLLIVPVFFIAPRLVLVMPLIIQGKGVRQSIKESWKTTKGNVWFLIRVGVLSFLIILLGLICLIVGLIPAAGITSLIGGVVFVRLTKKHVV